MKTLFFQGKAKGKSNEDKHAHLTCFGCGKKGHIKPNCPNTNKETANTQTTTNNEGSNDNGSTENNNNTI